MGTMTLPGARGTVELATGRVHDTAGRYVTTLPGHTVSLLAASHAEHSVSAVALRPTDTRKVVRRRYLTRWARMA